MKFKDFKKQGIKSVDSWTDVFIINHFSVLLTFIVCKLFKSKKTPYVITILSFLFRVIAGFSFYFHHILWGVIFVMLGFIFDGADRWKDVCFLAVSEDKRSTNMKFMPLLWGKRNKVYDDLMDKVLALDCDVYVITHMKDVYENINNPNPTGRVPDLGRNTFAAINQEIEVNKNMLPNKSIFYAKVKSSKTNPAITGKIYTILTVENGKVNWESITELQDGIL